MFLFHAKPRAFVLIIVLMVGTISVAFSGAAYASNRKAQSSHFYEDIFWVNQGAIQEAEWSGGTLIGPSMAVQQPQAGLFQDGSRISIMTVGSTENIFLIGSDGNIYETYHSYGSWAWATPYAITTSGQFTPGTSIASLYDGNQDIFAIGKDGAIYETYFPYNGWFTQPFRIPPSSGANFASNAGLAVDKHGTQDVFVIGYDNVIWETCFPCYQGGWSPIQHIPNQAPVTFHVQASMAAYSAGNENVYITGSDGAIWETYFTGTSWSTPFYITPGGEVSPTGGVAALYSGNGNQNVYWGGSRGRLLETYFNGTSWAPPYIIAGPGVIPAGAGIAVCDLYF